MVRARLPRPAPPAAGSFGFCWWNVPNLPRQSAVIAPVWPFAWSSPPAPDSAKATLCCLPLLFILNSDPHNHVPSTAGSGCVTCRCSQIDPHNPRPVSDSLPSWFARCSATKKLSIAELCQTSPEQLILRPIAEVLHFAGYGSAPVRVPRRGSAMPSPLSSHGDRLGVMLAHLANVRPGRSTGPVLRHNKPAFRSP